MEVREGYKKTNLGWIPENWGVKPLGFFIESIKGGASFKPSDFRDNGFKVIPKKGIGPGGLLKIKNDEQTYCSVQYAEENSSSVVDCTYLITTLRDLVPTGPNIGYIVKYNSNEKYILAQGVYGIKLNDQVVGEYLIQFSNSKIYRSAMNKIMVGSTQVHIRNKDFLNVLLPYPTLPEQQKLAEILTTVDDKILSIEDRIQQTKQLKKGLMEKLLTEGIRHTEFKDTEIGRMPAGWKGLCIGDVVAFSGGSQPPRKTFIFEPRDGYVRLIQIRDYKTDRFKTYIPENMARKFCSKDDIMIGRYGPPIFQILRGIEGAYNVALIKAIPKNGIEKDYLWHFLNQRKLFCFIENLSQRSSGQTGVDLDKLKSYPLPFPSQNEQKQIASILSTVDDKLDVLQSKKTNYETLKKGLMEQLLTGKRRVKV